MIATLNRNIQNYQRQLDALSAHVEPQDQINPLQSIVDNLKAKNNEL
jgi:hypothetical protein